jgi:ribosomal protein L11 methyltransferase
MDYIKITVKLTPVHDWYPDILMLELGNAGFDGFIETESGIEGYIPQNRYNENELKKLLSSVPGSLTLTWEKELIKERNWNEEWEKNYFSPLVIGDECLIRAPFHTSYPKCKYEIVIEPNMAFGTGNHETTTMMIEAILLEDMTDKVVLDMGCGTGILGILASMKGAVKVTAIDIDEWPVKGTKENATLNKVYNLEVYQGDAGLLRNESYDIILANIHKNVLMNDMPAYAKILNQNGRLFISGFYLADLPELEAKAITCGLKAKGYLERNKWIAAIFQS